MLYLFLFYGWPRWGFVELDGVAEINSFFDGKHASSSLSLYVQVTA
jgi:hypothetical protein